MEQDKEIDLEGLEEFDPQEATYQVWVFEYDSKGNLKSDTLIQAFNTPEEAIEHAKIYSHTLLKLVEAKDPMFKASRYEVVVETVVDFGDYDENIGTLFEETIQAE